MYDSSKLIATDGNIVATFSGNVVTVVGFTSSIGNLPVNSGDVLTIFGYTSQGANNLTGDFTITANTNSTLLYSTLTHDVQDAANPWTVSSGAVYSVTNLNPTFTFSITGVMPNTFSGRLIVTASRLAYLGR